VYKFDSNCKKVGAEKYVCTNLKNINFMKLEWIKNDWICYKFYFRSLFRALFINRINLNEWAFGLNSVVICEDNDKDLQELKYLQQVKWSKVINKLYKNSVHLSEYNFCDYTDKKKKFISTFSFVDSEKLNKIDTFLKNNTEKQVDIICSENTFNILR